jgi:hypothetical protein
VANRQAEGGIPSKEREEGRERWKMRWNGKKRQLQVNRWNKEKEVGRCNRGRG